MSINYSNITTPKVKTSLQRLIHSTDILTALLLAGFRLGPLHRQKGKLFIGTWPWSFLRFDARRVLRSNGYRVSLQDLDTVILALEYEANHGN